MTRCLASCIEIHGINLQVIRCAAFHVFHRQLLSVLHARQVMCCIQASGHELEGKCRAAAAATFQAFMQFLTELSSADSAGRVLMSRKEGV